MSFMLLIPSGNAVEGTINRETATVQMDVALTNHTSLTKVASGAIGSVPVYTTQYNLLQLSYQNPPESSKNFTHSLLSYSYKENVSVSSTKIQLNLTQPALAKGRGIYRSSINTLVAGPSHYYNFLQFDAANITKDAGIDQQQNTSTNYRSFGDSRDSAEQSFIPDKGSLSYIEVYLARDGIPPQTDNVTMNIYEASNDIPFGPSLARASVFGTSIPASWPPIIIRFNVSCVLDTSKQYCFVLSRTGAPDVGKYYDFLLRIDSVGYTRGCWVQNESNIWTRHTDSDLWFKTYGGNVNTSMTVGYRHSSDQLIWSSWQWRTYQNLNWGRHYLNWYIQQNLSQYFQFGINFTSNNIHCMPVCYGAKLSYSTLEGNYTINETDPFDLEGYGLLYKINVTLWFQINPIPATANISIFNSLTLKWDKLANSLMNNTWIFTGVALNKYIAANEMIMCIYCANENFPMTLLKREQVTFYYYHYKSLSIDKLNFNEDYPELIKLDTSFVILGGSFDAVNISLFNMLSKEFDIISTTIPISNFTVSKIAYYNESSIVKCEFIFLTPISIDRNIRERITYYSKVISHPEIDKFNFTIPLAQVLNVTLDLTLSGANNPISGDIYVFNPSDLIFHQVHTLVDLTQFNITGFTEFYNTSLILKLLIISYLPPSPIPSLTFSKNITITVTYFIPSPSDLTWLWVTLGAGVPAVAVTLIYFTKFYKVRYTIIRV
jgi:hypothetical protein